MPRGLLAWSILLGASYLSAKAIVHVVVFLWRVL